MLSGDAEVGKIEVLRAAQDARGTWVVQDAASTASAAVDYSSAPMNSGDRFTPVVGTRRGVPDSATTRPRNAESSQPSDAIAIASEALAQTGSREQVLPPVAAHLLSAARYAAMVALLAVLGVAGAGIFLIVEGVMRRNNGFAILGVVCMVATLLASGAGAWRIAGAGIEVERQATTRIVAESPWDTVPAQSRGATGADSQERQQLQSSPVRPPP